MCVEHRDTQSEIGDAVAVGMCDALDQPVEAESAKVVGHPARGHRCGNHANQGCEVFAKTPVGETVRQETEDTQTAHQGLNPWVAEFECRCALVVDHRGELTPWNTCSPM